MGVTQFGGNQPTPAQSVGVPAVSGATPSAHTVQFYGDDTILMGGLVRSVGAALGSGGAVLLAATSDHLHTLDTLLRQLGFDLASPTLAKRYVTIDAPALAGQFIAKGVLDVERLQATLLESYAQLEPLEGASILIFGEMSAVLWQLGFREAALDIERTWHNLSHSESFVLHCAYPLDAFDPVQDAEAIRQLQGEYTQVIPEDVGTALDVIRDRDTDLAHDQAQSMIAAAELRRRNEMALAVQRAELNDLLEQMLDGIQQMSPDRTIRWANRAVLEMLGYSAQAYVGHRLSEFFVDQAAFESWFSRLQQGEIIVDLPVTMRARDGSERFVRLYAVPNAKLQGAPETYRVYTRDVTGRLHMEQTLRDRNRELHKAVAARDEFLSVAAHELKTPATTLRAYTQLLLRDLRRQREISPSRLETSLAAIEAQSKKLDHLVSRLLDSGQIDEGRLRMVPVVTDVAALLRSVAESQRLTMHRTIEVHAPDVLHVLIDPVRFEQVMTNLVNNAIKFSPEGGRIELALTLESNGSLRFTVTDEGIGVPDSELAAIFSRFYQGISASHLSGLGLGLYITREIVKLHGGDIAVEHPDHPGARFVVTLPASVVLPAGGSGIAEDT